MGVRRIWIGILGLKRVVGEEGKNEDIAEAWCCVSVVEHA
jgi:hypothetical protein